VIVIGHLRHPRRHSATLAVFQTGVPFFPLSVAKERIEHDREPRESLTFATTPTRERSMTRSRNAILEALAQIGNSELSSEHILDFFKEVGAVDNHRSAALLLATHLENALQFALISRLKINHKRFNDIFGYDAPMGNFDRKVRVAHAIGMITDETRLTLDVIRRIRNAFAHALIPISFNTPQVTNACSLLKIPLPFHRLLHQLLVLRKKKRARRRRDGDINERVT
jgi:hypothetical protein